MEQRKWVWSVGFGAWDLINMHGGVSIGKASPGLRIWHSAFWFIKLYPRSMEKTSAAGVNRSSNLLIR